MLGYGFGETAIGMSRGGLFHADPAVAAKEVTARADDALRAQHDAQSLSEIGTAVKEAKTTAQVPDRLKSLVEMAAGGREDAHVYFQDAEWDKYWQSKGTSPATAAADIMGDQGKAYYEAKSTGAPLAIRSPTTSLRLHRPSTSRDCSTSRARSPMGCLWAKRTNICNRYPRRCPTWRKRRRPPLRTQDHRSESIATQLEAAGRSKAEAKAMSRVPRGPFPDPGR